MSASELQSVWWTWVASQPRDSSPISDTSGRFCMRDQPKDVWLLAGSDGVRLDRQCRIPADKPVLVPAVNSLECDNFMATARGEVLLDDVAQELIRIESAPFTFDGVAGNAVNGTAGRSTAAGCGLWAWIAPPSAGEHTLVVRGSAGSLATDVTYRLIVGADLQ
ncbi:signal protein [Lentzea tibetensis]|uniref:Signal protein n=1 Tax=Lentzea tibetensis TaxID=2591470 RepID=A0A563EEI5_9PSEU|nr:signal protein [Lentzea tibetensis]TWP43501.1 signal protein [Lentzea tibetensis]